MDELEQRKQKLLAEIANLDNLRIERDEILKQITSNSSLVADLIGEIAEKKQELEVIKSEKATTLAAQDIELQNKVEHVQFLVTSLEKERTELEDIQKNLAERSATLDKQESDIVTKKEDLLVLEARTNMNNGILNDRETKIKEQEMGIELVRKESTLKASLLDEREKVLTQKEDELTQRKDALDKFEKELEERNQKIFITAAQRDASDKEVEIRRAELTSKEKEVDDKFGEIADEIKAIHIEKDNLSAIAQDLEKRQRSIEVKELELKVKEKELKEKEKVIELKSKL